MSALTDTGSGKGWRKIRARIVIRDGGICQLCGNEGDSVDHITPRSQGGSDADYNLQLLCR
jgi:5-methylcytosine-specific restriction protein A